LIQTALESVSFGVESREFALTETAEPQLDHRSRRSGVLRDAQERGYRPTCFVWITRLSDGIQHLITAVCREEDSVQSGELLSG
jgi:hypothetical protein